MATKAIKFSNNTTTYLPVTDATLVQMKVGNETKSVQEVILEDEEVTAAAYNELNSRIDDIENTENSFNMWEILENVTYNTERLAGIDGGIHYLTQAQYNSLLAQFLEITSTYSIIYLQDENADSSKRKICTFYQENTGFLNDANNSELQNGFIFAFDGFEDTHNQSTKYTLRYFPNNTSNQQYFIFKNTDGYITDRASFKTQQNALASNNQNNYGILVTSDQITENSASSFYGNPRFSKKITIQESTGVINGRITEAEFALEAGSANLANNALGLAGGATKQIAYQTNVNSTGFITAPTNNTYLMYNGSSFSWQRIPEIKIGMKFVTYGSNVPDLDATWISTYIGAAVSTVPIATII